VHDPALGGERIFLPLPFDVDQRPLPAAEQEVLNAREGQKFINGVFGFHEHVIARPGWVEAISYSPLMTSYTRLGNSFSAIA
jgi:hypothetical protein